MKLEVIAFDIESCLPAQDAGADRIELCANPAEGGTTPSYGFIKAAREKLHIKLYPIIRPRGGDFLYTAEEVALMKADIKICKELGCDGVVLGLLHADGRIDKERTKQLVDAAYPMGVTFHRAFDRVKDATQALEDVIETGCERVLTSGLKPTATEGAGLIAALLKQANNRIILMPGSGVRAATIRDLQIQTGAVEFHTSARKNKPGAMIYRNIQMHETLETVSVDTDEIRLIKEILTTT